MTMKSDQSYKVEVINDVFSISLKYHPVKLNNLLMDVARYDEMRKQLLRKRSDKMVYLINAFVGSEIEGSDNRIVYTEYQVRLQKGDLALEYVPIHQWSNLAEKLGLYIQKDARQLKREALKAKKHIQDYTSEKLGYSLLQFLFEALHAATGSPVSEEKQKELEKIGSMVDKCRGLRLAGKNSPAGLRRGGKRELEELVKLSMLVLGQRNQSITYDAVANFLQTNFEFVPTLTGETLRKAVSHHRLNWKKMKDMENFRLISGKRQKRAFLF